MGVCELSDAGVSCLNNSGLLLYGNTSKTLSHFAIPKAWPELEQTEKCNVMDLM